MQLSLYSGAFESFAHYIEKDIITPQGIKLFQEHIFSFYAKNKRTFMWRETTDPYHIVVSEIMLQQTQTQRVKEKFAEFIYLFPTFEALAQATQRDVIASWQGLGYNRRALALHSISQRVVTEFSGKLPQEPELLITFKGIGPNTAGSIAAFAFNKPTIFIETNIRTVFIHSFFSGQDNITDKTLLPLIKQTLVHEAPREWYYGLMDYGVSLKKNFNNPSRKSKHHTKQSKFEGSERQIRGMILKALTQHMTLSFEMLCDLIEREPARIKRNLNKLLEEKFIKTDGIQFYM